MSSAEWPRVRQEDGLWIHEFQDGFIVDRHLNERSTLCRFDQYTQDTWEYIYSPANGDVIVDIGAGIGSEVHRFSTAVGPTGVVVAIEAHPATFACLKRFCELNKLDNVIPLNLAIVAEPGTITIDDPATHISSTVLAEGGTFEVEGTSLDSLLDELKLDRVDFLKMNIEGAERLAIEGMSTSLRRLRYLCISCHDFKADQGHGEFYRTKRVIESFLRGHGFSIMHRRADDPPWIRDQVHATHFLPSIEARARLGARALRQAAVRIRASSAEVAARAGEGAARGVRSLQTTGQRAARSLKYSEHGYTRVVALKILLVRVLRFLHLKPPPPGA